MNSAGVREISSQGRNDLDAHGVIRVILLRANGLVSKDRNGKSDPYVKFELAGQKHKSEIIKKTLDPVWDNASFDFSGALKNLLAHPLSVHVWDYDSFTRNDFIGDATVDLRALENAREIECDVRLADKQQACGHVYLRALWIPDVEPTGTSGRPLATADGRLVSSRGSKLGSRVQSPYRSPGGGSVPANVQAIFDYYDTNKSGYLDYHELQDALKHYGVDVATTQAQDVIAAYDADPNRRLDVVEFARLAADLSAPEPFYRVAPTPSYRPGSGSMIESQPPMRREYGSPPPPLDYESDPYHRGPYRRADDTRWARDRRYGYGYGGRPESWPAYEEGYADPADCGCEWCAHAARASFVVCCCPCRTCARLRCSWTAPAMLFFTAIALLLPAAVLFYFTYDDGIYATPENCEYLLIGATTAAFLLAISSFLLTWEMRRMRRKLYYVM